MVINYCIQCGKPLCWNSDFDFEDYGILQDGVIGVYSCHECESTYEFFDGDEGIEFVKVYGEQEYLH